MASSVPDEEGQQEAEQRLTLRVKCKLSQNITIRDVSSLKKVEEFLKDLSSLTSIPSDQMALLRGFPPKRIPYETSMTIQAIGITDKDTITVELDRSGHPGSPKVDTSKAPDSPAVQISAEQGQNPVGEAKSGYGASSIKLKEAPKSNSVSRSGARNLNLGNSNSSAPASSNVASYRHQVPADYESLPLGMTGVILRKVVPSDNSCLFSAVTFCLTGAEGASSAELRELISTTVLSDPEKYNEGFLGRSNLEYVEWISNFDSWGGGIELSILSEFYGLEINVMDTQYLRINRFGEDKDHSSRIFLIYDGIHYDALYLECYDGSRTITKFPTSDTSIYDQVMQMGREANATHQYTDVKNFTLQCQICSLRFKGPAEAQAHAKETRHSSFAEYK